MVHWHHAYAMKWFFAFISNTGNWTPFWMCLRSCHYLLHRTAQCNIAACVSEFSVCSTFADGVNLKFASGLRCHIFSYC